MTATFTKKRRTSRPRQVYVLRSARAHRSMGVPRNVPNREERRLPLERVLSPQVTHDESYATYDEEMDFVKRSMMWMTLLAITPLVLFFVLNFFYPGIFLIPIAP